ncbi:MULTISPECIES: hypothetical protein [unclassified Microbulbifer]|uniref:hypothetical protein n=1 Tax=unclassified Microbulbifer TaxID=2619833 RepID=UPI0027E47AE1|nr:MULTISPECIES: hypothetical protein [unclassified Microbulbifer]
MNRWVACAAFKGLELYDGKLSRTVLMGRRAARPLATRCLSEGMQYSKEEIEAARIRVSTHAKAVVNALMDRFSLSHADAAGLLNTVLKNIAWKKRDPIKGDIESFVRCQEKPHEINEVQLAAYLEEMAICPAWVANNLRAALNDKFMKNITRPS